MQQETVLAFDRVERSYNRGTPVLDGVTFAVQRDQVVSLIGRNGAGKSTLLHIAMGMLHPHAGSVRTFGLAPTAHPVDVKRRIGFVSEQQMFPAFATIAELIALHRSLYPTWDHTLERSLLERFGLAGNASKIYRLSKGQAQQVALLCAVCHRPELLILDEPAGGLDPAARREFLETSIQLLNREGTAILLSSHHMGDVERIGGRVVLLDQGKVRIDAPVDALREEHCLAIVPQSIVRERAAIASLPGCLRVREVHAEWHAMFAGSPVQVQTLLQRALAVSGARCVALPIEELFVELVGGTREERAA